MLTKRSIEVLLRVERMMEDAARALRSPPHRSAGEPARLAPAETARAAQPSRRAGRRSARQLTAASRTSSRWPAVKRCGCFSDFSLPSRSRPPFGLGLTWFALTRGTAFGAITIGAWTAWPKTGTADIDPYARATIARSGELPIGSGDGVAFYRDRGRQRPRARRALRRDAVRHHAACALLDPDAVRPRRPARRQCGRTATASPARRSRASPTAVSRS